jgi:hypothetical protein
MDRQQVYALAIPYETDFLAAQRYTQEGLALLAQDLLGAGPVVSGLACNPASPPALAVIVSPGRLYQTVALDATAYGQLTGANLITANGQPVAGGLAADSHQVLKQGLLRDPATLPCPAPTGAGASINYLIEAMFQEIDASPSVLQFFNTQNPATPLAGPNINGLTLPTIRACQCIVQAKPGTAAATGSQTTPAVDAGWIGLYVVTVASGQIAITAGNISTLTTAPFLTQTVSELAQTPGTYAVDTSGTANTIIASLSPAPTVYAIGSVFQIVPANANTGAVTVNLNGLGAIGLTRPDGTACVPNDIRVGKAFDVVIKSGPTLQMLSWPQQPDGPKIAISGAAHTFAAADGGNTVSRSNSGSAMFDTLPGETGTVLPAGWSATVVNSDVAGILCMGIGLTGPGATLSGSGVVSPSGGGYFIFLGPGQRTTFTSDGTNYQCWGAPPRAKCTAPLTLYVSPSGSDDFPGITTTAPMQTAGRAYAVAQNCFDLGGFQPTISLAAGAFSGQILCNGPLTGQASPLIIQGAGAGSTSVSASGGVAPVNVTGGANVQVAGMTCTSSGAGSYCLFAAGVGSVITLGAGLVLAASSVAVIGASQGGVVNISNSYTASGSPQAHWAESYGAAIYFATSVTVTLTGTPAYAGGFATATGGGIITVTSNGPLPTFSGSATGPRYNVGNGAIINTNGAGASALPGSTAGSGTGYF